MALIICTECGKQYSDKAKACPECGCPTESEYQAELNVTKQAVESCEYSKEKVIQYLSYAAGLEKTLITYERTYNNLQNKILQLGLKRNFEEPERFKLRDCTWTFWWSLVPVFIITFIIVTLIQGGDFWADLLSVITVVLIFFNTDLLIRAGIALGIAVAVAFIIFIVACIVKGSMCRESKERYKEALDEDEERLQNEFRMIKKIQKQQEIIKKQYASTKTVLERLYSLDVIYPKYRGLVPVVMMLEYFESGRCNQLQGAHGAYDTYAYEEKQNIIICKLDQVINMLDQIKNTQYLLYESIQESIDVSYRIFEQSEKMLASNKKIAENTELTAYNTDIIRQNTTISAYIDVFG